MKIGIVGLPNVGKSTFFNVLTKSEVITVSDCFPQNTHFCMKTIKEGHNCFPLKQVNVTMLLMCIFDKVCVDLVKKRVSAC